MTAFENHRIGSGFRLPRFDIAPASPKDDPLRYYVGRSVGRGHGHGDVWVLGEGVASLSHGHRWSADPFAWGATCPGAVELAAALLYDHVAIRAPRELASLLAEDLLEMLPGHSFVLTEDDLRLWLDIADCGRPRRRRRDGRHAAP